MGCMLVVKYLQQSTVECVPELWAGWAADATDSYRSIG
jgi:hypothetical protein